MARRQINRDLHGKALRLDKPQSIVGNDGLLKGLDEKEPQKASEKVILASELKKPKAPEMVEKPMKIETASSEIEIPIDLEEDEPQEKQIEEKVEVKAKPKKKTTKRRRKKTSKKKKTTKKRTSSKKRTSKKSEAVVKNDLLGLDKPLKEEKTED